ncbi:MAG: cyanophycin synthetase [Acinetobacter sp.]
MLNEGLPYISSPQFWQIMSCRASMYLVWQGHMAKPQPRPCGLGAGSGRFKSWLFDWWRTTGFSESARLGGGKYFCVEADEYDSAFFDKSVLQSSFTIIQKLAILNNLEFDHADIFDDLFAIQKQFHHLVRTIPSEGRIIAPITESNIDEVLTQGCWTPVVRTSLEPNDQAALSAELISADGSHFNVNWYGQSIGEVKWNMTGQHSVANALTTIAAAQHVGVTIEQACEALSNFGGVKRRMELLGTVRGIEVYDDFAHHPTAIETTLDGARKRLGERKLWAIVSHALIPCVWAAIKMVWHTLHDWPMK